MNALPPAEALTGRRAAAAILTGLFLIVAAALLVRQTEMVTGRYVQQGIPPIPAFATLLIYSLSIPLLRRHAPRLAPNRAQSLLVYAMLTVGTILSGAYHIRAFLPHLVSLRYNERADGPFAGKTLSQYLPTWLFPSDPAVVKAYYEGGHPPVVPWDAWIVPLLCWSGFLLLLFVFTGCLVVLVQRRWTFEERLAFPLLALPLAMASGGTGQLSNPGGRGLFWLGFAIAAVFNLLNITRVFAPGLPAPGFYSSLNGVFVDRPWEPLSQINFFYMLEAIGIGYFVPLEVSFSTWFFYLLNRAFAVSGTALGYDQPGFPHTQDGAAGGYLAVGLLLLWGLRKALTSGLEGAFRPGGDRGERWVWIGLFGSIALVLTFCAVAGMSLKLALPFFAILALFTLVYARIRAETGVPFGFIYPYGLPKEGLLNAFGFDSALAIGGAGSLVLFSSLAWLSRHHPMEEYAAYQLDSVKIGQEARLRPSVLITALLLAFVVGLGMALWIHLDTFYAIGSNMAGGGNGTGEFRASVAQQEYQQLLGRLSTPPPRDLERLKAQGAGFVFTALLYGLRLKWIGCPFHPLGFLIGTSYGDSSNTFLPLFVAWLFKAILLRYGGLRLYRGGIPVFLGLAIGHFFFVGIFWPLLSASIGESSAGYTIYFGG